MRSFSQMNKICVREKKFTDEILILDLLVEKEITSLTVKWKSEEALPSAPFFNACTNSISLLLLLFKHFIQDEKKKNCNFEMTKMSTFFSFTVESVLMSVAGLAKSSFYFWQTPCVTSNWDICPNSSMNYVLCRTTCLLARFQIDTTWIKIKGFHNVKAKILRFGVFFFVQ